MDVSFIEDATDTKLLESIKPILTVDVSPDVKITIATINGNSNAGDKNQDNSKKSTTANAQEVLQGATRGKNILRRKYKKRQIRKCPEVKIIDVAKERLPPLTKNELACIENSLYYQSLMQDISQPSASKRGRKRTNRGRPRIHGKGGSIIRVCFDNGSFKEITETEMHAAVGLLKLANCLPPNYRF